MKLTFTKKELLNIPNILCYIRLLCVPAFALAFFLVPRGEAAAAAGINAYSYMYISLAIFAFASITDIFDGKIARRFHMESAVGAALDPLADKLLQLMAVICLTVNGNVFWIFPVLIGIRELYQIICASMLVNKNIVGKANYWGKSAAMAVAFGIIVSTIAAAYSPNLKVMKEVGMMGSWYQASSTPALAEGAATIGASMFWTAFAFLVVGTVLGYIAAGSYTHVILTQLGGVKKIKDAENVRMDYFHNKSEKTESREELKEKEQAAEAEATEAVPQEEAAAEEVSDKQPDDADDNTDKD